MDHYYNKNPIDHLVWRKKRKKKQKKNTTFDLFQVKFLPTWNQIHSCKKIHFEQE